ncbi:MAG TPA: hypothetical protein DCE42_08825 [Myxococcales bacterium]|nr:hypothetical protein [Deltaproteobacteria bacterium]MBU50656.1 hypothetical protein [Deltaproteobacteria bacterium]HAA54849.1 hypothetical protein [Myxococcales bacterium]|tara:strand:+ start:6207 stop:6389 length:183 start_codon:yes stop_codon:yes gene_type:complete
MAKMFVFSEKRLIHVVVKGVFMDIGEKKLLSLFLCVLFEYVGVLGVVGMLIAFLYTYRVM